MAAQGDEQLVLRGEFTGHSGWVTGICTGNADRENVLVSVSRDRSLLIWDLTIDRMNGKITNVGGKARRALTGHSHFIQDVVLSSDNNFALTGSWDTSMRLWDLNAGRTTYQFRGHSKDVMSVTMSPDNRQIISASRDKTLKLWNTLAECKYTFDESQGHTDWVSSVRFTPTTKDALIVSAGWDRQVKVWRQDNLQLKVSLIGHTNCINAVTISPNGHYCASGGKDNIALMWDLQESKQSYTFEAHSPVNALAFSPSLYWLAGATDNGIKIWDIETKRIIHDLKPQISVGDRDQAIRSPQALSAAWSHDGEILFTGWSDNKIRAYALGSLD